MSPKFLFKNVHCFSALLINGKVTMRLMAFGRAYHNRGPLTLNVSYFSFMEKNGHGTGVDIEEFEEPALGINDVSPVDDFDDTADVEMEAGKCFSHKVLSLSFVAIVIVLSEELRLYDSKYVDLRSILAK